MPCRHQLSITACDTVRARTVVPVERAAGDIPVELRAIGRELLPEAVEHLDRQAARIGGCLHHDRRDRADEHQLGHAAFAMPRGIVRGLAASGRMADVHGIAQIEMRDHGGDIRGVVVHVVAIADLAGSPVPTAVVGDDAIPLVQEEEHLGIPIVAAQWPAMMEHDGLRALRTPVLVENRRPVVRGNRRHGALPIQSMRRLRSIEQYWLRPPDDPYACAARAPSMCDVASRAASSGVLPRSRATT